MRQFHRFLAALGLLLASGASTGCQDVRAFVTGDPFRAAPVDVPRVEVEVFVEFSDEFFGPIEDRAAARELRECLEQSVLDHADLGLRFYPLADRDYRSGEVHPDRLLVVRFDTLTIGTEHEMVEDGEAEPWIETSLTDVRCEVFASIGKRRPDAPTLIIGRGPGDGSVRADEAELDDEASFALQLEPGESERMYVLRDDVVAASEEALVEALRELIVPVDRELMAERRAAQQNEQKK
ncbi:MAG: hypothetical protein GY711_05110 [bacterium]|nr:hypothetical protein [bacterium]